MNNLLGSVSSLKINIEMRSGLGIVDLCARPKSQISQKLLRETSAFARPHPIVPHKNNRLAKSARLTNCTLILVN